MDKFETMLLPAYLITPMLVLETEHYTEGIVFDSMGNLYFSQTKAGNITVLAPDGEERIWASVAGANGHKIDAQGTHIVAAEKSLVKLDANGEVIEVIREVDGKALLYPNDITIDPEGGFYFTDSGDRNSEKSTGCVYYVDAVGHISQVATEIAFANGLVLTHDRKQLFVAESWRNRILVYNVLSPGNLGVKRIFAELPTKQGKQIDNQPDGICLDKMGNLYVAHYGMGQIIVLNQNGQLIRRYNSGNLTTSNCAFSNSNFNYLFVTGGIGTEDGPGGIFRLHISTNEL
ncbi:MAG: SMP-30/gluconolactonase/LRE family protein [Calothrix sp. C42_A2020_038]|nr:SMP-30/gluconolactonase/LRE family protein [Calothrix sp. C42_A2020_038]